MRLLLVIEMVRSSLACGHNLNLRQFISPFFLSSVTQIMNSIATWISCQPIGMAIDATDKGKKAKTELFTHQCFPALVIILENFLLVTPSIETIS